MQNWIGGSDRSPVASGLLVQREEYFDALTAYRRGEIGPIAELDDRDLRIQSAVRRA